MHKKQPLLYNIAPFSHYVNNEVRASDQDDLQVGELLHMQILCLLSKYISAVF